jgi:hypothetical protein
MQAPLYVSSNPRPPLNNVHFRLLSLVSPWLGRNFMRTTNLWKPTRGVAGRLVKCFYRKTKDMLYASAFEPIKT